jgi:SOS regulatory protein LexA
MELDVVQQKIVRGNPFGISIVKGKEGSGKTIAAIYRVLHLKNNYCIYDEDGILMVSCNDENIKIIKDKYDFENSNSNMNYLSLFSNNKNKVNILKIDDLIKKLFDEYVEKNGEVVRLIAGEETKTRIIKQELDKIKQKFVKLKFLNHKYLSFFLDEIKWIKACCISTLEEYQLVDRVGRKYEKGKGPQRLLKNSVHREAIYQLMQNYNMELEQLGLMDYEDKILLALDQAKHSVVNRFTHILVDDSEYLTKAQLELVKELSNKKAYSSMTFTLNPKNKINSFVWFLNSKRVGEFKTNFSGKSHILKKQYEIINEKEIVMPKISNMDAVEKYEYIDIKHNRAMEFLKDLSSSDELVVKENSQELIYNKEELKEVPVYSNIAAGEPIMISSEQESTFLLPQHLIKGMKDCFILRVKGDSMINANIDDGDFVVIKKVQVAQNREIVAAEIDGSATLKRLSLDKGTAILMPENPKYNPIPLYGMEANILGVAVGIIKNR